jgi:hypothetical protein
VNSEPLSDAVRAPSRAADEMAVYVYSNRQMSIAEKRISNITGATSENSTSAWERWLRALCPIGHSAKYAALFS